MQNYAISLKIVVALRRPIFSVNYAAALNAQSAGTNSWRWIGWHICLPD